MKWNCFIPGKQNTDWCVNALNHASARSFYGSLAAKGLAFAHAGLERHVLTVLCMLCHKRGMDW